jgi:hypothetical protein
VREGATRPGENPDRGVEACDLRNTPRTHGLLNVLQRIAERLGRPMAHVALAWLWTRPGVASVLLGARTDDQLAANPGAADLALVPSDIEALTKASDIGVPPYPYGFLGDRSDIDVWRRRGSWCTPRGTKRSQFSGHIASYAALSPR